MSSEFTFTDLTKNLPSLAFESVIGEENKDFLSLRARAHCLHVSACLHTCYYLSVASLYRRACVWTMKKGCDAIFTKFSLDMQSDDAGATKVGIIGYGRLGSALCTELLNRRIVLAENVYIHTRNTDAITRIRGRRVVIEEDASKAGLEMARRCGLLLVCVPPSQLASVARVLLGPPETELPFETVLAVYASGVGITRLRRLFRHEAVLALSCGAAAWTAADGDWETGASLADVVAGPRLAGTCPLPIQATGGGLINFMPKLMTLWIYSLTNVATGYGLDAETALRLLNFCLFRTDSDPHLLQITDLVQGVEQRRELLPRFSLASIAEKTTFLDERLESDSYLQNALLDNYQTILAGLNKHTLFADD